MMHPMLMVTFNNLALTKEAVKSALSQDIEGGISLTVVNNGSTDGTHEWLSTLTPRYLSLIHIDRNESPAKIVNSLLPQCFAQSPYLFLFPNDVILHPSNYREFLRWPRGLVTGSEIRNRKLYEEHILALPPTKAVSENTPMAVLLLRKWAYDAVVAKDGQFFDERYTHYASDCDLALRVASCGIRGVQLSSPYWHFGSASVRLADPFNLDRIRAAADHDRELFQHKWGFKVDSLEYGQCPSDPNFRGESL